MSLTAIILALITILMWSFLALLGARLSHLPAFLVVGIALTISGLLSVFTIRNWRVPLKILVVGVGGIFGYHFFYFSAFKFAPAVEANLINYLWPLLIVLLSPLFLRDFPLQFHHMAGGFIGLLGAGLIITKGGLDLERQYIIGYILATAAAVTWACYSLLTKRLPVYPTGTVGAFCLISGFLSLFVYQLTTSNFQIDFISRSDWIALFLLGAGPMGAAFFTWDASLKRGDPRIIGSLAYLTPLTSTLVLVLLGGHQITWISAIAMLLIVSGALIGSMDLLLYIGLDLHLKRLNTNQK